jgi:hypothetical protein
MENCKSLRTALIVAATIGATQALTSGCVSDYRGYLGHQTESEAKLWGNEISILSEPDPDGISGTYAPTVKYDFRRYTQAPVDPFACPGQQFCTYPDVISLITYKNPTVGAFSRDGCVDRDGDNLQQRPGVEPPFNTCDNAIPSKTKFAPTYRWLDGNAGCQFFENYDKTFGSPKTPPAAALCYNDPQEEIDKDLTLQGSVSSTLKEAFASLDDLFNKIWSGALGRSFTAEVVAMTVNGNRVVLSSPSSLALTRNSLRPINWTVDLSTPGGKQIIQALLAYTEDRRPATLAFHFDGGLTFRVPSSMIIGFNHDALRRML